MNQLAPLETITLSAQVKEYILDFIASEKLTPGMAVPSEMQISQQLGVSRGIIREAYRSLAALGVLEIKSGKVPRVKSFDASVLQVVFGFALSTEQVTATQILSVRRWLELGVVEAAVRNGSEEDFARLRHEMAQIRHHFAEPRHFVEHDMRFHILLARASGNPVFVILLQALHSQLRQSISEGLAAQSTAFEYEKRILELHQRICDAVCQRDSAAATAAMQEHFDVPVSALVAAK
ncbi:FadR/GntR family transcriptional regulator [Entomohabitans teleogrylli]|uniref:FadR/GntR family transcriptional regulator n=1 Tax=Entomohabitans teleogrylli TaxID=1384589 RepID=UPI00073D8511|nr:FadR/GntR family transcriptional regulator [Entomohabitans teleogrylli]